MFDKSKTKLIGAGTDSETGEKVLTDLPTRTLNWGIYTIAELVRFRDEITRALPPTELKKLNLEEMTLEQFHVMRELQGKVIEEVDTPANQKAQVASGVGSILKSLQDRQIELYSSERFKEVENLLIRTLDKLGEELAASFIAEYEKLLLRHE